MIRAPLLLPLLVWSSLGTPGAGLDNGLGLRPPQVRAALAARALSLDLFPRVFRVSDSRRQLLKLAAMRPSAAGVAQLECFPRSLQPVDDPRHDRRPRR